jgi:cAMP-dependent protein kinase regulator
MANTDEEYLELKARNIIEPLVNSVLTEKPQDIFLYMIDYLQKLQGKNVGSFNMEREELSNLRKELKRYKKANINDDVEKEEVYSKKSEESEEEEEDDKAEEMINIRKNNAAKSKQRSGVSAEAYGKFNKKQEFVARVIKKTEVQKKRIIERIMMSFLFNSLEEKDVNTVIDAMEEKIVKAKTHVIKEGEQGDVLYLIESGILECYKTFVNEI